MVTDFSVAPQFVHNFSFDSTVFMILMELLLSPLIRKCRLAAIFIRYFVKNKIVTLCYINNRIGFPVYHIDVFEGNTGSFLYIESLVRLWVPYFPVPHPLHASGMPRIKMALSAPLQYIADVKVLKTGVVSSTGLNSTCEVPFFPGKRDGIFLPYSTYQRDGFTDYIFHVNIFDENILHYAATALLLF